MPAATDDPTPMIPEDERVPGLTLSTSVRVRYAETDAMGVVYHAAYVPFLEVGRTEFLRRLGYPYNVMEEQGFNLAIVDMRLQYRASAHYDELLTVACSIRGFTHTRLTIDYRILGPDGETVLIDAFTTLACLERHTGRIRRLPAELKAVLSQVAQPDAQALNPE